MNQPELLKLMAKAYDLQDTLEEERELVRIHNNEYQNIMEQIVASKVQKIGKYEVIYKDVQRKHQIISDKFRERWPELFNQLATVTMKAARERIKENDLQEVCELKTVIRPKIAICQFLDNKS